MPVHAITNVFGLGHTVNPTLITVEEEDNKTVWALAEEEPLSGQQWWHNDKEIYLIPKPANPSIFFKQLIEQQQRVEQIRSIHLKAAAASRSRKKDKHGKPYEGPGGGYRASDPSTAKPPYTNKELLKRLRDICPEWDWETGSDRPISWNQEKWVNVFQHCGFALIRYAAGAELIEQGRRIHELWHDGIKGAIVNTMECQDRSWKNKRTLWQTIVTDLGSSRYCDMEVRHTWSSLTGECSPEVGIGRRRE